ncbi:MAG: lysophospholipid acyltransferase family protein [Proteobacteria bacterium]|nr:lysophospholipid acyltransferase family protein [Pseudomonadota bacterium]
MKKTVFDTPGINLLFRAISRVGFWATGWKMEGSPPEGPKYVLIAAPHTSNWDLLATLCLAFNYKIKVYWMGKDSLFRFPAGPVLKWLGGIPVVRDRSTNMVERQVREFENNDRLILIVPPEGTRGKVKYWKTGFYHIAHLAKVPIAMGFIDFERKAGGFGPAFIPTGDLEKDMAKIRLFYSNIKGKREDLWSRESVAVKNPGPAKKKKAA